MTLLHPLPSAPAESFVGPCPSWPDWPVGEPRVIRIGRTLVHHRDFPDSRVGLCISLADAEDELDRLSTTDPAWFARAAQVLRAGGALGDAGLEAARVREAIDFAGPRDEQGHEAWTPAWATQSTLGT